MKSAYILRLSAIITFVVSFTSCCLAGGYAMVESAKPAVGIGLLACLTSSDDPSVGISRAVRAADGVVLSVGIAEFAKTNLDIGSRYDHGFPSAHTAAAFSMATSLSEYHPKQKWLYYAGAALIGWSTVETGGHSWTDVLGGAALGITVTKLSLKSENGLLFGKVFKF